MPNLKEIQGYFYPKLRPDSEKDDIWSDLRPSYQRECVEWLMGEIVWLSAPQPTDSPDKKCTHPMGYIRSVRICGLCGEQQGGG